MIFRIALLLAVLLVILLGFMRIISHRVALLISALFILGALLAGLMLGEIQWPK